MAAAGRTGSAMRGPGRRCRSRHAVVAMAGCGRSGPWHGTHAHPPPARLALQRHLLLGHHGRAQGHRPVLGHALGPCAARHPQRLRARCRLAVRHAAVLQHHPGRGPAHPGAGRHPGADAQVRRGALPGTGRAPPCHPHHARARAVPAADAVPGVRQRRPEPPAAQVLHQRTVPSRAQGRGAAPLARTAHRVLRHDRRRRALRAALP